MFKNRSVNVKLQKDEKKPVPETKDHRPIEEKVGAILKKFDKPAMKVFGCMCVYVLLDTFRQVQIARANEPYQEEED